MTTLRHVGIVVTDIDRSIAFYRDFLGLRVARDMEESGPFLDAILGLAGARVRTVKLAGDDGGQVELLAFRQPPAQVPSTGRSLTTPGPTHLALTVTGLSALHRRMAAAGIVFTTEPAVSADGTALVTFCRDPDGSFVELVEMLERSP